jgi:DNA ligase (NAD+)
MIIDSEEDTFGSFIVFDPVPKELTTIAYTTSAKDNIKKSNLQPTKSTFKYRRKILKDILKSLPKIQWHVGEFRGHRCLYTNDPDLFVEVYSTTTRKDVKDFQDVLLKAYNDANKSYHTGSKQSFLTDEQFDRLKEILDENKIKYDTGTSGVGAKVGKSEEKPLPHVMPSLIDEKTADDITKWANKKGLDRLVVTPKLDGVSLQLRYKNGKLVHALTRGDGFSGKDVTRHAMEMPAIPKKLKENVDTDVRVEAYITNSKFDSVYKQEGFKTARNTVAGFFNRNSTNTKMAKDIQIGAFEEFNSSEKTKFGMLNRLERLGLPTVEHFHLFNIKNGKNDFKNLPEHLIRVRSKHDVELDGLVVETNDLSKRKEIGNESNSINPAYARAFKPQGAKHEVRVTEVKYNLSKHGFLKPTVFFTPVNIKGATVVKATAFNAAYIRDNKIGPGAILEVTRSGDTIPYVVKVVKGTTAQLPKESEFGPWEWNETSVDAVLTKGNEDKFGALKFKQTIHFFNALGIEYFDEASLRKLWNVEIKGENPYQTIPEVLAITKKDLIKNVPGIKEKSAQRIRQEFDKLKDPGVSLPKLMYASGVFGRGLGVDKLTKIYNEFGEACVTGWADFKLADIAASIDTISGLSEETGKQFAEGIKPFIKLRKQLLGLVTIKSPTKHSEKLNNQTITMTKFRDMKLVDLIEQNGGKYSNSISNKTTILLVPNANVTSTKIAKAKNSGIKIMTPEQFRKSFSI